MGHDVDLHPELFQNVIERRPQRVRFNYPRKHRIPVWSKRISVRHATAAGSITITFEY